MQERKNIRRLVLLGILLASTVAVYFIQSRETRPAVEPALFKVADLDRIDHIELKSAAGTVKLDYNGTRWKVNERFDADLQRITVFFATLEKALPKRPVAAAIRDSVKRIMNSRGIVVSLREGSTLKKELTVGGNEQKTETYFMLEKDSEPYLITIPGYRVYVSQIFELGANEWRDRRIFGFRWENFKSLSMSLAADKAAGFVIEKGDHGFSVTGEPRADTSRLFSYLDDVSLLVADQIISPGYSRRFDSLAATAPVASLEIRDIADRTYSLRLFAPLSGETRVLGITQSEDRVLFDRKKLFSIVKKRTYFRSTAQ